MAYSGFSGMWPTLELEAARLSPFEEHGRRHYEESLDLYSRLLGEHPWSLAMLSKQSVLIAEISGGTGIGSIALAKALNNKGVKAEVLIMDARGNLLRQAERWGSRVGIRVQVVEADPLATAIPGGKYDVIVMHGRPPSLVDPWSLARLLARISVVMEDKGLFITRAMDYRYLWIRGEMRSIAAARDVNGKLIISIIENYDPVRGVLRKAVMRPGEQEVEELEVSSWSLAELASLLWLFFRDVDTYPKKPPVSRPFLLMGYRPRKILLPQDLEEPSILR